MPNHWVKDDAVLQSSDDVYAKKHLNLREAGGKKAQDFVGNSFAEHLEQNGFLKELWGGRNY